MSQLSEAIVSILRREGADKTMILGARLGALARDEHDGLLREEMSQRGLRFIQLVQEIPGVEIVRHLGTGGDVLIGLKGALPPSPRGQSPFLRPDVFAAFTRAGVRHSYHRETDEFHEGLPREGGVDCPEVRISDPAEMRAEFASAVPDPDGRELRATLDRQIGSLTRFREAMSRAGLTTEWEQFRYDALSKNIREWATARGIEIRSAWFSRAESAREGRSGPKELLADLARSMTDEEPVPFLSLWVRSSAIFRYADKARQSRQCRWP